MKFSRLHSWPDNPRDANLIQEKFLLLLNTKPERTNFRLVGGADVSYSKKDNVSFASIVVMKVPEMEVVEKARAQMPVNFPFIPGYFYFREGPVLTKALSRLRIVPDLFIFDGHGISHPKGIGMASQLGIMLDMPTVGCAKKLLCGVVDPLGNEVGDTASVFKGNQEVGMAVRSRENVKPIFISPGHKIDTKIAVEAVLDLLRGYRLPEPLRVAHIISSKIRRNFDNTFQGEPKINNG